MIYLNESLALNLVTGVAKAHALKRNIVICKAHCRAAVVGHW